MRLETVGRLSVPSRSGRPSESPGSWRGFRVWGLGFGVWDVAFRVRDSGLRVEVSGVRVQVSGFGDEDFRVRV